jgi:hypothetical protein
MRLLAAVFSPPSEVRQLTQTADAPTPDRPRLLLAPSAEASRS